jgi:hypothetical protein
MSSRGETVLPPTLKEAISTVNTGGDCTGRSLSSGRPEAGPVGRCDEKRGWDLSEVTLAVGVSRDLISPYPLECF